MQTKNIPYTFNRRGYYYFSRRIPCDLQEHYRCTRVVYGMKTQSPFVAKSRALVAATNLDEYWSHLRMKKTEHVGQHLLRSSSELSRSSNPGITTITLTDALNLYLALKGKGRAKTFHTASERACRYLVDATGLKDLHEYSRRDALAFRDYLVLKGLAGFSVTRVFNALVSVVNFAISEHALDMRNPFSRVYYDRTFGVTKRLPVPLSDIRAIQAECRRIDDDMRWLLALISDTGMRLAEAVGLARSDLVLDHKVPCVLIQPHNWRSLKTSSSERKIPLVGASLWAAQRIVRAPKSSFAFPRYNRLRFSNANSASAGLNKWLKAYVPQGCSIHSLRHSLRDRLREVNCSTEMIDQIGGWSRDAVGQGYGEGYSLISLSEFMKQI